MIESIDSPYIHEGNSDNFQTLVLDNSNSGPLLLNFWSKKAGPCLRQYPVLDKIVHEYHGKFLLINIDVDKEIALSKELGVNSVPTMKLLRHERTMETLHGYQNENDLRKVLNNYVARNSDSQLALALKQYAQGNQPQAYDTLAQAIVSDPENLRLPVALCKLLKHERRYKEAMKILASLPANAKEDTEIVLLQDYFSFSSIAEEIDDLSSLIDSAQQATCALDTRVRLAAHYVLEEDYAAALAELATILDTDRNYKDQYARKSMIKIFGLLGNKGELVKQYRVILSNRNS